MLCTAVVREIVLGPVWGVDTAWSVGMGLFRLHVVQYKAGLFYILPQVISSSIPLVLLKIMQL